MGAFTYLKRDLAQILFRSRDQHAIPAMDGAVSPNNRLDALPAIGDPLPGVDDVAEGPDGALYASAGDTIFRLSGEGYQDRVVLTRFDADTGGLAVHPDGRLLVCVAGRGLAAVDRHGGQSWLTQAEDQPLHGLTSVAVGTDGSIFLAEGSRDYPHSAWYRDLMARNHRGRLVSCGPDLASPRVLMRDLHYPHGLAIADGGKTLWFTESWSHCLSRIAIQGAAVAGQRHVVINNMAGYPARVAPAASGGFWLALFAVRTHLVEFVLREDEYRDEMIRTVPPALWVVPALATTNHCHEPMQFGSIKALGIEKPWAPPRSYGLVVRIDAQGEPVESLHSRVGGRYHGITAAREVRQGLVIVSKGSGRLILATAGATS